ncbi:hypothetical protein AWC02_15400 [Mycolicibacter engbaekii]|uniref:Uncharacterized protein n=1 Tax=Mycolicibacter engbaekii TaxID=188915 RepID=A0A1X1TFP4_9MYCO|nr:hypothetical protein AWC02_15400 [Mycolicibacter engbaekii]
MIGCRDEQTAIRPPIQFYEDHVHDALQFADIALIVSTLGHRIEFIEQQDTRSRLGVIQYRADITARGPQVA